MTWLQEAWQWVCTMFNTIRHSPVFNDSSWILSSQPKIIALSSAGVVIILSSIHIYRHLKLYTMPQIQVYVIRILFTTTVYTFFSSLALIAGKNALYLENIRDIYEAVVIYNFFNLMLEYGGGETDCVYAIENDAPVKMPCPLCCSKPRPRDARLLRFCHRGVLQFIILRPLMSLCNIILLACEAYYSLGWQICESVIYNISYAWALYCLFVFYLAIHKVVSPFQPIAKFTAVKSIIFATYYQSMILHLLLIKPETAMAWNDFLLSLEMILFAFAFMLAFPIKEFLGGIPNKHLWKNVQDVFSMKDICQNLSINFQPRYRDYALQRCQSEVPASIHVNIHMTGNMNPVAQEMTHRYRGVSSRKTFNAILRGANPVTAKIRRGNGNGSNTAGGSGSGEGGGDEGGGGGHVAGAGMRIEEEYRGHYFTHPHTNPLHNTIQSPPSSGQKLSRHNSNPRQSLLRTAMEAEQLREKGDEDEDEAIDEERGYSDGGGGQNSGNNIGRLQLKFSLQAQLLHNRHHDRGSSTSVLVPLVSTTSTSPASSSSGLLPVAKASQSSSLFASVPTSSTIMTMPITLASNTHDSFLSNAAEVDVDIEHGGDGNGQYHEEGSEDSDNSDCRKGLVMQRLSPLRVISGDSRRMQQHQQPSMVQIISSGVQSPSSSNVSVEWTEFYQIQHK